MNMQQEYTPQEREQALNDFDTFLFNMDDVLEPFVERAQVEGYVLDYSLNSLDRLEHYAVELDAKPLSDFHGQSSQYLGEVVRKNFGGRWILSLDMKENSLYYGKPAIVGHSTHDIQFAPYMVVRNFLLRHKPGLLKQAAINSASPKKLDLSHLPTEEPLDE